MCLCVCVRLCVIKSLRPQRLARDDAVFFLVGNKSDLVGRAFEGEDIAASALCDEFGLTHFRTSAKSGGGVEEAFEELARSLVKRRCVCAFGRGVCMCARGLVLIVASRAGRHTQGHRR